MIQTYIATKMEMGKCSAVIQTYTATRGKICFAVIQTYTAAGEKREMFHSDTDIHCDMRGKGNVSR